MSEASNQAINLGGWFDADRILVARLEAAGRMKTAFQLDRLLSASDD